MAMAKETLELLGKLRDAAKLNDPIARATIDAVKSLLEEAKEGLVTAEGDGMLRMQGEARLLKQLYRELTTTPPHIKPGAPA